MFLHYTDGAHLLTERRVNKLKKLVKWFSIFAVIGTAIGLAVAYDFDLDADLQPASDREYVSLKKTDDDTDGESESLEEK